MLRSLTLAFAFWASWPASAAAQPAPPSLYRVFLSDGSTLASFGEWTRVDNLLVFSMPLVPGAGPADLHLVSVPVERVDLARTERYAEAVRAAHYAATRGEADFALLSSTVAHTLNQVAVITDPRERLATAEQARRSLADWPREHFGYRAAEVREIIGVLDEVISSLRATAGQGAFELTLSANTDVPSAEPLLPPPGHADVAQGLMTAAALATTPAEKVSLLQSVVAFIDRGMGQVPSDLAATLRATALGQIAEEQRLDAAYARLRDTTLTEARRSAERADVRALERLRQQVQTQDAALGSRRTEQVVALAAALDAHLEAARRLRLAQDQWLLAEEGMRAYRAASAPAFDLLLNSRRSLDDVKLQAGPAPQRLLPLARELDRQARRLALLEPPAQLASAHAVLRSAMTLAENAIRLRRDAVQAADLHLAAQAAAAASGALMLLDRARQDLEAAMTPPIPVGAPVRP